LSSFKYWLETANRRTERLWTLQATRKWRRKPLKSLKTDSEMSAGACGSGRRFF
jgi:hypothetical protein